MPGCGLVYCLPGSPGARSGSPIIIREELKWYFHSAQLRALKGISSFRCVSLIAGPQWGHTCSLAKLNLAIKANMNLRRITRCPCLPVRESVQEALQAGQTLENFGRRRAVPPSTLLLQAAKPKLRPLPAGVLLTQASWQGNTRAGQSHAKRLR